MRYSFFSFSDMKKFINTDRHRNFLDGFMPNSDDYPWVPTGPIEVKFERTRIYRNAWFHSIKHPGDSQTHQVRLYDPQTDSYYMSDELNREVTAFFDNIGTNNPVLEPRPVLGTIEEVADNFSEEIADNFGGLMSPLEVFAIHSRILPTLANLYFSFTNLSSLSMLLTLGLVLLLFFVVTKKGGWKVSAKCIAILGRAIL